MVKLSLTNKRHHKTERSCRWAANLSNKRRMTMKRSNRLVARSAVALSLAASLTACGTASSTTTTAASSEAATETASCTETVNRLFIARIDVFVTCVFPIQQFFALASASHGNFNTLLRHIQTLSLPKISSGKCSSRTGCFLLS